MTAANRYTTAELLTAIKRTGHIPPGQNAFSDSDLLALADYELQTAILNQVLSARENYYLTYLDYSVNDSGLYDIPTRAIGGSLADVEIFVGTTIYHVSRTELSEQYSTNSSPTGNYSFMLQGNQFSMRPNPTSGTVRAWYYQRPNALVVASGAGAMQITNIVSNVLDFDSVLSTITTSTPLDFIKDTPHFDWIALDQTAGGIFPTSMGFTTLPSPLAIGDWVCLAGQTAVPQIPVEYRPLLVQRVVVKYYEIQGYLDKMKAAQAKLTEMEKDVQKLINPRVAEAPKRIVPDCSLIGGYRRWRAWRAT